MTICMGGGWTVLPWIVSACYWLINKCLYKLYYLLFTCWNICTLYKINNQNSTGLGNIAMIPKILKLILGEEIPSIDLNICANTGKREGMII